MLHRASVIQSMGLTDCSLHQQHCWQDSTRLGWVLIIHTLHRTELGQVEELWGGRLQLSTPPPHPPSPIAPHTICQAAVINRCYTFKHKSTKMLPWFKENWKVWRRYVGSIWIDDRERWAGRSFSHLQHMRGYIQYVWMQKYSCSHWSEYLFLHQGKFIFHDKW